MDEGLNGMWVGRPGGSCGASKLGYGPERRAFTGEAH